MSNGPPLPRRADSHPPTARRGAAASRWRGHIVSNVRPLLLIAIWVAGGCAHPLEPHVKSPLPSRKHITFPAISMVFDDQMIESIFATSNKAERELLETVLAL